MNPQRFPPLVLPRILGILLAMCGFLYLTDPLLTFGAPALGRWRAWGALPAGA